MQILMEVLDNFKEDYENSNCRPFRVSNEWMQYLTFKELREFQNLVWL
jgi:hypothetical protein